LTTPYPIITLFFNATKSHAATNGMTAILIINLTAGAISALAAASRQLWAFARDHGVPFSGLISTARRLLNGSHLLTSVDSKQHSTLRGSGFLDHSHSDCSHEHWQLRSSRNCPLHV
jgi:hypothetical protein